jgi:hypothetical protein
MVKKDLRGKIRSSLRKLSFLKKNCAACRIENGMRRRFSVRQIHSLIKEEGDDDDDDDEDGE